MTKPICLGIDTGSRTGLCVYDRLNDRILEIDTVPHDEAEDAAARMITRWKVRRIRIEEPHGTTYRRPGTSDRAHAKIARNVGQNIERACHLFRELGSLCADCRLIAPEKGSTKWPVPMWRQHFNWASSASTPSNHARDAAYIARYSD